MTINSKPNHGEVIVSKEGAASLNLQLFFDDLENAGPIIVNDEGTVLTTSVTSFDFVGTGVTAAVVGNVVTVTISGGTAPIDTVFGRTGTVVAASDDYTAAQVTNAFNTGSDNSDDINQGGVNLFFLTAERTKLTGVETLADVTDEANVTDALDGATLSAVTVAETDKVLIQDVSDSDKLKTVTSKSIASLAGSIGTITPHEDSFIATASQTNFTLTTAPEAAWVWLRGAAQDASTWSISGSDIVLGTGATVGDAVEISYITSSGGGISQNEQSFTATASQTNFTLTTAPVFASVWLRGAAQDASEWSISGNDVVLVTPATAGDAVEISYIPA